MVKQIVKPTARYKIKSLSCGKVYKIIGIKPDAYLVTCINSEFSTSSFEMKYEYIRKLIEFDLMVMVSPEDIELDATI